MRALSQACFLKKQERWRRRFYPLFLAASLALATPIQAFAHPDIFGDAKFEAAAADGTLNELRDVWRFDQVLSSCLLLNFDKNKNMALDPPELVSAARTVRKSLAEYNYYTTVTVNG